MIDVFNAWPPPGAGILVCLRSSWNFFKPMRERCKGSQMVLSSSIAIPARMICGQNTQALASSIMPSTSKQASFRRGCHFGMAPFTRFPIRPFVFRPESLAVAMKLALFWLLDLFVRDKRHAPLTDRFKCRSRLTSRLAQKSAPQPLSSQMQGHGLASAGFRCVAGAITPDLR